jgi:hypothetical protein
MEVAQRSVELSAGDTVENTHLATARAGCGDHFGRAVAWDRSADQRHN